MRFSLYRSIASFTRAMNFFDDLKLLYTKVINWFLCQPKLLIRFVVLSVCSVIVFFQLWYGNFFILAGTIKKIFNRECAMKLLHPPISTHSDFKLNETMHYPAVTFCRNPAFKKNVLEVIKLNFN